MRAGAMGVISVFVGWVSGSATHQSQALVVGGASAYPPYKISTDPPYKFTSIQSILPALLDLHEARVDVLAAAGLVAMDGQDIGAGPERGPGSRGDGDGLVVGG